jgi:hypothetical protein
MACLAIAASLAPIEVPDAAKAIVTFVVASIAALHCHNDNRTAARFTIKKTIKSML